MQNYQISLSILHSQEMTPELSEDEDVAHILCNSLAVLL